MCKQTYPTKIKAYSLFNNPPLSKEPEFVEILYTETELDNFKSVLNENKVSYQLQEFKPKLKELKRFNLFEKLAYAIPLRTQLSDILVDAIKVIIGIIIGYGAKTIIGQ